MNLNHLDLNLLLIFDALMEKRRVRDVAESVGLSQPAVSSALRRLRETLGDELFLRTADGMVPTPFAEQIATPVAEALATLERSLWQRDEFDPQGSDRIFRIAMSDIGEIYFLPRLLAILREGAPGVQLETVRSVGDDLRAGMLAGRIDLAIGLLPGLQGGFRQRRLFQQSYVCLLRRDHPSLQAGLPVDWFQQADHVVVRAEGTGHGEVDQIMDRAGIMRNVVLRVPHFVALGHILQDTDLVATVPQKYAESCLEPFDLIAVDHPVRLPETGIYAFWHDRFHKDAANHWLRNLIAAEFAH